MPGPIKSKSEIGAGIDTKRKVTRPSCHDMLVSGWKTPLRFRVACFSAASFSQETSQGLHRMRRVGLPHSNANRQRKNFSKHCPFTRGLARSQMCRYAIFSIAGVGHCQDMSGREVPTKRADRRIEGGREFRLSSSFRKGENKKQGARRKQEKATVRRKTR